MGRRRRGHGDEERTEAEGWRGSGSLGGASGEVRERKRVELPASGRLRDPG